MWLSRVIVWASDLRPSGLAFDSWPLYSHLMTLDKQYCSHIYASVTKKYIWYWGGLQVRQKVKTSRVCDQVTGVADYLDNGISSSPNACIELFKHSKAWWQREFQHSISITIKKKYVTHVFLLNCCNDSVKMNAKLICTAKHLHALPIISLPLPLKYLAFCSCRHTDHIQYRH